MQPPHPARGPTVRRGVRVRALLVLCGLFVLVACTDSSGTDISDTSLSEDGASETSVPTTRPATTRPATTDSATTGSTPPVAGTDGAGGPIDTVPFRTPEEDVCALASGTVGVGVVADDRLVEISGVVASRAHEGVLWVHNDSGGGAIVYGIGLDGATVATVELSGTAGFDWEDIAIGPGPEPGRDYLYIGDIGDNFAFRPFAIVVRIPEPDPTVATATVDAEEIRVHYPGGAEDAEGLAVDPVTAELLITTKTDRGGRVLSVPLADTVGGPSGETVRVSATEVATLDLGGSITAFDIRPDGTAVLVRGYDDVWAWSRSEAALGEVFAAPPCPLPAPRDERQGEAIGFVDGGYVLISEGINPIVNQSRP